MSDSFTAQLRSRGGGEGGEVGTGAELKQEITAVAFPHRANTAITSKQ